MGIEILTIRIIHTADLHGVDISQGHVRVKKKNVPVLEFMQQEADHTIILDGGDIGDLGLYAFMNGVPYTCAIPGNHDVKEQILQEMVSTAAFPITVANIKDENGDPALEMSPYLVVNVGWAKIAIVALITQKLNRFIPEEQRQQIRFTAPLCAYETTQKQIEKDEGVPDLTVLATHLEKNEERKLLKLHPEIPLIIAAHRHEVDRKGTKDGNTLIARAGSHGKYLGVVTIQMKRNETGKIEVSHMSANVRRIRMPKNSSHKGKRERKKD